MQRPSNPAADRIIGIEANVLDKGFVRLVDYMGDDAAIVQAARVSYGAGTKTSREDSALIDYLMRNDHTTPFEMVEFKFHIKAPMFVARQWLRHRTASVNEVSARYSVVTDEFYIPRPEELRGQGSRNKQVGDGFLAQAFRDSGAALIESSTNESFADYEALIADGHARELARMIIPQNVYTQWYWKIDLHNLFHFLRLRLDAHAQEEIRVYARAIASVVGRCVPAAFAAWREHVLLGQRFSNSEISAINALLKGADPDLTPEQIGRLKEKLE